MNKASKIVSSAILGTDIRVAIVNSKRYVIEPPTIKRMAGAGQYLSDLEINEGESVFNGIKEINNVAYALSWFIYGDDKHHEEFLEGTLPEVTEALRMCLELIGVENFTRLLVFARNVQNLIATRKS